MTWIRTHFWGFLIVVALVASFVVSNHDSKTRDRAQAHQAVAGCMSRSAAVAIDAAGWHRLAGRVRERNAPGDKLSAANYDGISVSMTDQLFAPPGMTAKERPRLVDVLPIYRPNGTVQFVLTQESQHLQRLGCEARYL